MRLFQQFSASIYSYEVTVLFYLFLLYLFIFYCAGLSGDIPLDSHIAMTGQLLERLEFFVSCFDFGGVIIWGLSQKAAGALFVKMALWIVCLLRHDV